MPSPARIVAAPAQLAGAAAAGAVAPAHGAGEGVRRLEGSADARRRSSLGRVDYQDAFAIDLGPTASTRSAEGWLRELLEGAPSKQRSRLVLGWSALGLRLGSREDPGCVLGWRVRRDGPDAIVVGARSRIGMPAELILLREEERLVLSTLIRFGNPAARALWAAVEPTHLNVVPRLLAQARRRALAA